MAEKKSSSSQSNSTGESSTTSNSRNLDQIKKKRRKKKSPDELANNLMNGSIPALSQAITLVESSNIDHCNQASEVLKLCLPKSGNSIRIGITGVPGVGKSTFIETFGDYLLSKGHKIAVLAVDPSSSLSKGSILGDKTRMETLVKNENAFIRPSASGNSLGGVARKTRETILLCEAAGYDTILIETVGVGQSETSVHGMVDFFLLLKLSGAGDQLQGIKRGIMEMADCIAINKADGDNEKAAKMAQVEFRRALHLYPLKNSHWQPKVITCSALTKKGIPEIASIIEDYIKLTKENGYFEKNRKNQNKFWLMQTIEERLKTDFFKDPKIKLELARQINLIESGKTTPFLASDYLLSLKN